MEAFSGKIARSRLGVPKAFIASAIDAVEQSPELAAAKKLDPVIARDRLQYVGAFDPLLDKFIAATKVLKFRLHGVKDSVAGEAQQLYRIAQQHASDGRSPMMAALVVIMSVLC